MLLIIGVVLLAVLVWIAWELLFTARDMTQQLEAVYRAQVANAEQLSLLRDLTRGIYAFQERANARAEETPEQTWARLERHRT